MEVTAMTLADEDRDIPARRVRGTLTVRHVETLGYDQYLVDGVDVDPESVEEVTANVFCPTGPGGGIDPTCSPGSRQEAGAARDAIRQSESLSPIAVARDEANRLILSGRKPRDVADRIRQILPAVRDATRSKIREGVQRAVKDAGMTLTPGQSARLNRASREMADDLTSKFRESVNEHLKTVATWKEEAFEGVRQTLGATVGHAFDAFQERFGGITERQPKLGEALQKRLLGTVVSKQLESKLGEGWINTGDEHARTVQRIFHEPIGNAFCPTGPGGGVDPSCSPDSALSAIRQLGESSYGLVSLDKLGKRLGVTPEQLHKTVMDLARKGKVTFSAAEGRHGLSEEERRWLMKDPGSDDPTARVGYVVLK